MAQRAHELARHEARRASATEKAFDESREDSRRGLIAVALGAALVITLLLQALPARWLARRLGPLEPRTRPAPAEPVVATSSVE